MYHGHFRAIHVVHGPDVPWTLQGHTFGAWRGYLFFTRSQIKKSHVTSNIGSDQCTDETMTIWSSWLLQVNISRPTDTELLPLKVWHVTDTGLLQHKVWRHWSDRSAHNVLISGSMGSEFIGCSSLLFSADVSSSLSADSPSLFVPSSLLLSASLSLERRHNLLMYLSSLFLKNYTGLSLFWKLQVLYHSLSSQFRYHGKVDCERFNY